MGGLRVSPKLMNRGALGPPIKPTATTIRYLRVDQAVDAGSAGPVMSR